MGILMDVPKGMVKTETFTVRRQKNPLAVDYDHCDAAVLPDEFVEWEPKILGASIIRAVKENGEIPKGAALKDQRWHLRIQ